MCSDCSKVSSRRWARTVRGRHRLLGHGQRERRGGLGGRALARDELVREPLEQLRPQVEHAGAELARLLGAPGEVGDGRGAIGHRRTLTELNPAVRGPRSCAPRRSPRARRRRRRSAARTWSSLSGVRSETGLATPSASFSRQPCRPACPPSSPSSSAPPPRRLPGCSFARPEPSGLTEVGMREPPLEVDDTGRRRHVGVGVHDAHPRLEQRAGAPGAGRGSRA